VRLKYAYNERNIPHELKNCAPVQQTMDTGVHLNVEYSPTDSIEADEEAFNDDTDSEVDLPPELLSEEVWISSVNKINTPVRTVGSQTIFSKENS
jgi:hypothetical protein